MTARADRYGAHPCSLANAMSVVAERWTFLILREALQGTTRFSDFRDTLGLTAEVLTTRLSLLVDAGVMVRHSYREEGRRTRWDYHLTPAGQDLRLVLAALQQWADEHTPSPVESTVSYRRRDGSAVAAAFVDGAGHRVAEDDVEVVRAADPHLAAG